MKRNKYKKYLEICPCNKLRDSYRKNILFVEGINDKKVFDSIINSNWIVVIYGDNKDKNGKQCIIDDFKNKFIPNQIAIVDRDYDTNEHIKNLYYTDYNDIESTAINLMNSSEIKKALKLKKDYTDNDFDEIIFNPVLNLAIRFSNLWKYFHDNNIKKIYLLNSDNYVSYLNRIVGFDMKNINYNELKKIYGEKYKVNNINFEKVMSRISEDSFRGHDFFKILQYYFKINNIDTYFINENSIEKGFIANSVEYLWIKKSKVYNDIKISFTDCLK